MDQMKVSVSEIAGFVMGPAQGMEIVTVERGLLKLAMEVERESLIAVSRKRGPVVRATRDGHSDRRRTAIRA